jgi:hypothetical protein
VAAKFQVPWGQGSAGDEMKADHSGIARIFFLISMLFVLSAPVAAQYTDNLGGNWNNPASATITNIIMDRYARRRLEKNLAARRSNTATANGSRTATVSEAVAKTSDAAVRFRSTGTQLKAREIANLISPGNEEVFTLFSNILQEFDKEARKIGKPNDLALALSFFLATNATIYHNAATPSDALALELRDTIAAALVEGNAFSGVTDRKKQEMYEVLVIYTGLALATQEEGKSNPESAKTARQLAGMNLHSFTGISPDKISFTDQGLSIESENAAANNPVTAPAKDTSPTPASNSGGGAISHVEMIRAYDSNEIAADGNYKGKRVRVSGPFSSAEKVSSVEAQYGKIIVWFWHTGYYSHLGCFFEESERGSVAQLKDRQSIVLEGTMLGLISPGRLMMNHCVVKSVEPRKE